MKASTLVIMLCIGLMCSTGFGQTTADLTENSKTEMVQVDDSVSVVSVYSVVSQKENKYHDAAVKAAIQTDADLSYEIQELLNYSIKVLPDYRDIDRAVGWRFNEKNYNQYLSFPQHRNPRDGINYDFPDCS